jgi:hypothetical protein
MRIVRSERIDVVARSYSYFPAAFRWRGRRYDVVTVEKCWTAQRPVARRMFRVRCAAGAFVLEQCLADDTWRVNRWPLVLLLPWPRPAAPARFSLPRSQRRPARQSLAGQPRQLAAPAHAQANRRPPWTTVSQQL